MINKDWLVVAFFVGGMAGSALVGLNWNNAVTSGDYFTVGTKLYSCNIKRLD